VVPGRGIPNDLSVDGARDAVLELEVHLGNSVLGEDGGIRDITCRYDSLVVALEDDQMRRKMLCRGWNFGLGRAGRAEIDVRIAADSTMLRMVNLLTALSLGTHREQLEQRTGLTWPRPFLLRPLYRLMSA
jgi:hypothetical protein